MDVEMIGDRILERALTGKIDYDRGIAMALEAASIVDMGEWEVSDATG